MKHKSSSTLKYFISGIVILLTFGGCKTNSRTSSYSADQNLNTTLDTIPFAKAHSPGYITTIYKQSKISKPWKDHRKGSTYYYTKGKYLYAEQSNGLPTREIKSMTLGPDGAIWFGHRGVSRYKDSIWINFNTTNSPLQEDFVKSINAQKDSSIWLSTYKAIYEIKGDNWTRHSLEQFGSYNSIYEILKDTKGTVWARTSSGLLQYDGENWSLVFEKKKGYGNKIHAIAEDWEGNIWITKSTNVLKYDRQTWQTFTHEDHKSKDRAFLTINVLPDSQELYFGTEGKIVSYDGRQWKMKYTRYNSGIRKKFFEQLLFASDSSVWVRYSDNHRIFQYKSAEFEYRDRKQWPDDDMRGLNRMMNLLTTGEFYPTGDLPADDAFNGTVFPDMEHKHQVTASSINTMIEDQEGRIWYSSNHSGYGVYENHQWTHYEASSFGIDEKAVTHFECSTDSTVWTMNKQSIGLFKNGRYTQYHLGYEDESHRYGTRHHKPQSVQMDSTGAIWVLVEDDILKLDLQTMINKSIIGNSLQFRKLSNMYVKADGTFYFTDKKANLYYSDGKTYQLINKYFSFDNVQPKDTNTFYFTERNSLKVYSEALHEVTNHYDIQNTGAVIVDYCIDENNQVWAATTQGLWVLQDSYWKQVTPELDSLSTERIYSVDIAPNGDVWIGAQNGITIFSATGERKHMVDKQLVPYTFSLQFFDDKKVIVRSKNVIILEDYISVYN